MFRFGAVLVLASWCSVVDAQSVAVPPPPSRSTQPDDVEVERASALHAHGAYAAASALLWRAISRADAPARTWFALGHSELHLHDATLALAPLERAVDLAPRSARFLAWYGVALALVGRLVDADVAYRDSSKLDERLALPRTGRAILAMGETEATWLLVLDDDGTSGSLMDELRRIQDESGSIMATYVGATIGAAVGLGGGIPLLWRGASYDTCHPGGVCGDLTGVGVVATLLGTVAIGLLISAIVRDVEVGERRERWRDVVHRVVERSVDGDAIVPPGDADGEGERDDR